MGLCIPCKVPSAKSCFLFVVSRDNVDWGIVFEHRLGLIVLRTALQVGVRRSYVASDRSRHVVHTDVRGLIVPRYDAAPACSRSCQIRRPGDGVHTNGLEKHEMMRIPVATAHCLSDHIYVLASPTLPTQTRASSFSTTNSRGELIPCGDRNLRRDLRPLIAMSFAPVSSKHPISRIAQAVA